MGKLTELGVAGVGIKGRSGGMKGRKGRIKGRRIHIKGRRGAIRSHKARLEGHSKGKPTRTPSPRARFPPEGETKDSNTLDRSERVGGFDIGTKHMFSYFFRKYIFSKIALNCVLRLRPDSYGHELSNASGITDFENN